MKRVQQIDSDAPDRRLVARAAHLIHEGRLVAYPTETFYGLGADPFNPEAVDRIFEAKGRPERLALPLIVPDEETLARCVRDLPEAGRRLARAFWPGALTLVLPAAEGLPTRLLGGGRTVGVRLSPHPIAAALAKAVRGPIVATSANRSGHPAPSTAAEVDHALGDAVALVLDGGSTRGELSSTVLDLTSDPPTVIRSGAVPLREVERVLERRLA